MIPLAILTVLVALWVWQGPKTGRDQALRSRLHNMENYPSICFKNSSGSYTTSSDPDGHYRFTTDQNLAYVFGFAFWPVFKLIHLVNDKVTEINKDLRTPQETADYIAHLERELGIK